MGIKTQIRLIQVTGSVVDFKPGSITQGQTAAAFGAGDLSGSLQYFAQAISNINGNVEFGNVAPGLISFATQNDVKLVGAHSAAAQNVVLQQHDGTTADGLELKLASTGTDTAAQIQLNNDAGTGASAIDINATAGGITVDAGGGISIDAAGVSNLTTSAGGLSLIAGAGGMVVTSTGDAATFTVASDAAAEDLTLRVTGAHDSSVLLSSTGTGTDAIGMSATAGGITMAASHATAGIVVISGGKAAILSGSDAFAVTGAVSFSADKGFTGTHEGGMNFANSEGEFINFRAHSTFSGITSVVGALNALAQADAAFEPTLFAVTLGADINAETNVTVAKVAGDSAELIVGVGDNKAQIFVNGQLMRSSSGGGTNDYAITAANILRFQFGLKADDVVQAWEYV